MSCKKISKTQRMPSLQPCSAVTGAFGRPVRSGCNQIDEEPFFPTPDGPAMRVRIFIDFWNFQLSWNEYHQRKGAQEIVRIVRDVGAPCRSGGSLCGDPRVRVV